MGDVVAGRFELIDLLGSGGAGSVWRAWDHKQRRYLAAKVLKHSDADSISRFIREARTMVEDEHVLVPRNWVGEDDRVLFTTDLVRGGSVAMLMAAHGPLPERWVLELGRQTALALRTIHAQGLVHRDVKPANLLLEPTGRNQPHLWLADFGIATSQDAPRLTATHLVLGTPGYLCPEAYHGAVPAPSQDMWALGAVLRHLATGLNPPAAHEPDAWRSAGEQWPLSARTGELVSALLSPQHTDRPSAEEVIGRIDALLAAAPADVGTIEIFDRIGLPPAGWGPDGPVGRATPQQPVGAGPASGAQTQAGAWGGTEAMPPPTRYGTTGGQTHQHSGATPAVHAGGQPSGAVMGSPRGSGEFPIHSGSAPAPTRPAASAGRSVHEERALTLVIPVLCILLGAALVALAVLTW